jgi:hypothetical protein
MIQSAARLIYSKIYLVSLSISDLCRLIICPSQVSRLRSPLNRDVLQSIGINRVKKSIDLDPAFCPKKNLVQVRVCLIPSCRKQSALSAVPGSRYIGARIPHAHLARSAISPPPNAIHPKAKSFILSPAFCIWGLNMNSWAISSTSPV